MEFDGRLLGAGAGTVVLIIVIILIIWILWENEERERRLRRQGYSSDSFSLSDLSDLGTRGRDGEHDNKVIVLSVVAVVLVLALGGATALYSQRYRATNKTVFSRTTTRLSNLSGLGRSTGRSPRSSVL